MVICLPQLGRRRRHRRLASRVASSSSVVTTAPRRRLIQLGATTPVTDMGSRFSINHTNELMYYE